MTTQRSRAPALVIGLDCVTGLQTARILAKHDIPVMAVASDPDHYCCRTRVVRHIFHGDTDTDALITLLEEVGPLLDEPAVLYPCTDASVLTIARNRERISEWFHVALPDTAIVEMLQDKIRFAEYAQLIGLPAPKTRLLRTREEAQEAAEDLVFPCMLKPALKTARWQANASAKVYRVESAQDFLTLYERCAQWTDQLIIQEWIDGPDAELFSCNCYFDAQSKPVTTFVARKLRQWPPRMGMSSLGEECRNDTVLDLTLKTFGEAGYRGLGYLEVKRDPRSGRHFVIEANVGRPTGRSAIAEAGGVDLLYAQYCDVLDLPLPENLVQRYQGAKWIFWRQDLRSALYYRARGELTLSEWLRSIRGRKAYAVFSWSDPLPFLADAWGAVRQSIKAVVGRVRWARGSKDRGFASRAEPTMISRV